MPSCFLILAVLAACENPKTKESEAPNSALTAQQKDTLMEGDILFQISTSGQGKAIQLATHSPYSHCGILFKEDEQWMVFEGVQPVKKTPLTEWIARGDKHHYVVKRHKKALELLTPEVKSKMKAEAKKFIGKNYDLTFEWSDDRIYCSELVHKIYTRGAGISIGTLQELQDFDLSHPIVLMKIKERYGKNIPLHETVISPGSLFNDTTNLELITEN
jgi:hypothetical protein